MAAPISFTMTNDSITVIRGGKVTTVPKGAPNFPALKKAIMEEWWEDVPLHLTVESCVNAWLGDKFVMKGADIFYNGLPIQKELTSRIMEFAREGRDPTMFFDFWESLSKNPSSRSVSQLFTFLNNQGIPITQGGKFLAYKAINSDWTDIHSGTVSNKIGTVNKLPRNQISDDPSHACHFGFHVGALEYAQNFGGDSSRIIICEVSPEHVVCVPYDHHFQKMRVCEYKVIGNYGSQLPSSSFQQEDLDLGEGKGIADTSHDKATGFGKYDKMSYRELLTQSTEDLRKYAAKHLCIIGASKISGGKSALVDAIVKVRK